MHIAIVIITEEGRNIAIPLLQELHADLLRRKEVAARWHDFDAFVFIGAMGICVRTIAPLIADKHTDPAVVCVDSLGHHAVSVLSGHIGGANDLTERVASALGATPVITTQSDNAGLWALDTLGRSYQWEVVVHGGGSINILYKTLINQGTINANGGVGRNK